MYILTFALFTLSFRIPVNYLPGTRDQLKAHQLTFIQRRVERFMRELDIPGIYTNQFIKSITHLNFCSYSIIMPVFI